MRGIKPLIMLISRILLKGIMRKTKRRYVYEETYDEVIEWAQTGRIRSINYIINFPDYLEKYIKYLKAK